MRDKLNGKKIWKRTAMVGIFYIILLIPFLGLFYNNLPDMEENFSTPGKFVHIWLSPSVTGAFWVCFSVNLHM